MSKLWVGLLIVAVALSVFGGIAGFDWLHRRDVAKEEAAAREVAQQATEAARLQQERDSRDAVGQATSQLTEKLRIQRERRDSVAEDLETLGHTLAAECETSLFDQARRNQASSAGARAWLIRVSRGTFACLGARSKVEAAFADAADAVRKLADDDGEDKLQTIGARAAASAQESSKAARGKYDQLMRKTLRKTAAPAGTQGQLFALVIEASEGERLRVSGDIRVRSDSADEPLPIEMKTPGLDQLSHHHSGLFVALVNEPTAPTWTFSVAVPLQVVSSKQGFGPDTAESPLVELGFDFDTTEGGVLSSLSRFTLPGSELEQLQRAIREEQAKARALEAQTALLPLYVAELQRLQGQLRETELQNQALQRYDELLASQIEKHSKKPMAADIIEGVVVKAVVAGVTTLIGL